MRVHRNQNEIRSRLYLKLGLIPGTPQHKHQDHQQRQTQSLQPSCFTNKRSILHRRRQRNNVSFQEQVRVIEIPSHRDYDPETRARLWNDRAVASNERDRNKFEFWVDGCNWRNATEEHHMILSHCGTSLIHPATWARYLQAQAQQQRYNPSSDSSSYYHYNPLDHPYLVPATTSSLDQQVGYGYTGQSFQPQVLPPYRSNLQQYQKKKTMMTSTRRYQRQRQRRGIIVGSRDSFIIPPTTSNSNHNTGNQPLPPYAGVNTTTQTTAAAAAGAAHHPAIVTTAMMESPYYWPHLRDSVPYQQVTS